MDEDGTGAAQPQRRARLTDELERALGAIEPEDCDAALVSLLHMQARELDGAAALEARARRTAEDVADRDGRDSALYERVEALSAALGRRQAVERIGREYRAGLVELLGTPKSRGAGKAPERSQDGSGGGKAPGRLGELYLASGGATDGQETG